MTATDPNIVMFGIFIAMAVILGCIMTAMHMFDGNRRQMERRLERMVARHSPNRAITSQAAIRRIRKDTGGGRVDSIALQLLPRPTEIRARLERTGTNIT
ncbi:MAG: hypothetical protein AAGF15_06025, partial [Pseudomonadota bacterium]